MTKYFLHHFIDGNRIQDPEGEDFQSLEAAEAEAIAAARELVANAFRAGKGLIAITCEIASEAGDVVTVVPFQKVLEPS